MTDNLRIFEPHPGVLAFYDGRITGQRFAAFDNWVDNGAIELGIASYAILSGTHALVYDTHVSVPHALAIRAELTARGVGQITVVLSHWHLDHVAGTEAFAECEVIANTRTAALLAEHKAGIEDATHHGPPAINPLILPTRTFSGRMTLTIGRQRVDLIAANIHSDDATVLWLPDRRLLFAGDTVEDCVTYIGEPADLSIHLADLDRLAALGPSRILPNHGHPDVIAAGGYGPGLIAATQRYIRWLREVPHADVPMTDVIGADVAAGILRPFAPYEAVHAQNVARVRAYQAGHG